MFQANPDVNVVYGHNDPMAEAAIISAEAPTSTWTACCFIGIDGLPTPDGGIRSVLDGRIDVTYVYPTGGEQAIDYAVQILEQGVVPPDSVTLETEQVRPTTPRRCWRSTVAAPRQQRQAPDQQDLHRGTHRPGGGGRPACAWIGTTHAAAGLCRGFTPDDAEGTLDRSREFSGTEPSARNIHDESNGTENASPRGEDLAFSSSGRSVNRNMSVARLRWTDQDLVALAAD